MIRLEYLFQVGDVSTEVASDVFRVLGITAALYDQPSFPLHLVEGLLHLPQVDTGVAVKCHTVSQRSMNLGNVLTTQFLQLLAGVQTLIYGILQVVVNLDALALHLFL